VGLEQDLASPSLSTVLRSRRLLAAARPEETAKALAQRHGPPDEKPALRKNLGILRQVQMGEVQWIVKNPVTMKYHQFKNVNWLIVRLFDGTRTRSEIVEEINRRSRGQPVSLQFVLEYEEFLRDKDLIEQSAAERALNMLDKFRTLREKKAEEKAEGFNVFFIMFHVVDPDRFLNRTIKYVRWIWSAPVAIATVAASIWTAFVFSHHWTQIWTQTMDLYHFLGKPFVDILQFFAILCVIACIHEFSHAYACKRFGAECHDIGFALFYFTPAFYSDTSDTFMLSNPVHRLWIAISGIYTELMICSIATALWVASYPDTFLHAAAYKVMLFTGVSAVFFNINPLIKVDGYYALSSLLRMNDLREGGWHQVGAWVQKHILRLPVEVPETTRRKRLIYWIYGLLSIAYTATIMLFVYRLFRNFYYKYFPDIAIILLLLTLYQVFRKKARTLVRVSKLMYLDKKELLMSPRSRMPLAAAAVILLLVLAVPWSRRTIGSDALLKPVDAASVQAPEEGVVTKVLVHEGQDVQRGQPLFGMSSPAVDAEARRSLAERDLHARKSSANQALANAGMTFQSASRASAAQTALETAESRQGFLVVRSPIAGRVLTSRPEDLEGRYVAAGFNLADVGDCRKMVAEVPVSERLLEYLNAASSVTAQVQTHPMTSYSGAVAAISPATMEQPMTADGKEPIAPSVNPDRFIVRAVFDNPDGALLPGAAASVKIRSAREGFASRGWSLVWRWIRSIVW
jgi:putative peptide zinc metalloprotease protein